MFKETPPTGLLPKTEIISAAQGAILYYHDAAESIREALEESEKDRIIRYDARHWWSKWMYANPRSHYFRDDRTYRRCVFLDRIKRCETLIKLALMPTVLELRLPQSDLLLLRPWCIGSPAEIDETQL